MNTGRPLPGSTLLRMDGERTAGVWVSLTPDVMNRLFEFALAERRTVVGAAAILIERGLPAGTGSWPPAEPE